MPYTTARTTLRSSRFSRLSPAALAALILPAITSAQGRAVAHDAGGAPDPQTIALIAQQAYLKGDDSFDYAGSVGVSGNTVVVGSHRERFLGSRVGVADVYVRNGTNWTQEARLTASNLEFADFFGQSVAICGDTIVVGAPGEDSGAAGVNGDQLDNSVANAGAAYVFVRDGTSWSQQAYLKASNPEAFDNLGNDDIAISGDTVAIVAPFEDSSATGINGDQGNDDAEDAGAAYVFVRNGTSWSQQAYLKPSNTGVGDGFGSEIAASGDTIVVGAAGEDSDASGVNGDGSNDNSLNSGAAYVFVRSGTVWSRKPT